MFINAIIISIIGCSILYAIIFSSTKLFYYLKQDTKKVLATPIISITPESDRVFDGYTMSMDSDFTTGILVENDTGGYEILLTSPSGNHSTFALNHYAHSNGFPLHIVYSTGDKVWFYPCGKVSLVRDSGGKYWK